MADYSFIQENSRLSRIITIATSLFVLVVALIGSIFFTAFFYNALYSIPFASWVIEIITRNISNATVWGLFFAHLLGGIFFVPSPDEVIFYYGLMKGNPYILAFVSAISGYMIAQLINYYAGSKVSSIVLHVISKKKVYKARRFVNKYGGAGVFLFNFLPFPAPLLTFALGIANYNFTRFFILTLLGKSCKYIVVIIIYLLVSA